MDEQQATIADLRAEVAKLKEKLAEVEQAALYPEDNARIIYRVNFSDCFSAQTSFGSMIDGFIRRVFSRKSKIYPDWAAEEAAAKKLRDQSQHPT